jgi:AraC-like DNA-binding protein
MRCFAGLVKAAVPIFSGGEHVATLTAGRIFREHRRERDWESLQNLLAKYPEEHSERLKTAFQGVPVISGGRVSAAFSLLGLFAKTLEEHIPGWLLSNDHPAPPAVAKARDHILKHVTEPITLSDVAHYSGIGTYHLCKLFKKTTGVTFTDFLARSRVEKAKLLLQQNSLRVAEIAFASGFGSVPTFNRIFKRLTGQTATAYRAILRCSSNR